MNSCFGELGIEPVADIEVVRAEELAVVEELVRLEYGRRLLGI